MQIPKQGISSPLAAKDVCFWVILWEKRVGRFLILPTNQVFNFLFSSQQSAVGEDNSPLALPPRFGLQRPTCSRGLGPTTFYNVWLIRRPAWIPLYRPLNMVPSLDVACANIDHQWIFKILGSRDDVWGWLETLRLVVKRRVRLKLRVCNGGGHGGCGGDRFRSLRFSRQEGSFLVFLIFARYNIAAPLFFFLCF